MSTSEPPHIAVPEQLAHGEDVAMGTPIAPGIPGHSGAQIAVKVVLYLLLIAVAVFYLLPFFWTISTSFKTLPESVQGFVLIPHHPTLSGYREVFVTGKFAHYAFNSAVFAISTTLLNLFLCTLGGYAFARLRFPLREPLFMLVLATLMIPDQLRLVPVFQLLADFPSSILSHVGPWDLPHWNLINTYQGYILLHLLYATNLFLMRQYFLTIPRDYEEAAKLDSAGFFKTYWKVMLPLAGPAIAAITILSFQGTWNDFYWQLILLQDEQHFTLNVGIARFASAGGFKTEWPALMAASTLAIAPVGLIYLFFQRYFIAGVTTAGVKG
jgi:multiple sugar transport system permease protein